LTKIILLRINHKFIKQKDHIKYLGVVIDSHFNFKEHIHQLSKKISRDIGISAKLHYYVSVMYFKTTLLLSHISFSYYGAIIWGNIYVTTLHLLIVLQRKVVRIITFCQCTDHTSPGNHHLPTSNKVKIWVRWINNKL